MDLTHVRAFAEAMRRKDITAMLARMSDDVVLNTPLAAEPVIGKAAIREVVTALFGIVDTFEVLEIMEGPSHASSFFRLRAAGHVLDGMDYWRTNEAGLIDEMSVLWRPLPAANAVADRLRTV